MAMSKTAAIREASRSVSIQRCGYNYQVTGPYYIDRPSGPSTTSATASYSMARVKRAKWAASVAIALMGLPDDSHDDIEAYFHGYYGGGNDMREAVEYAIRKHKEA